MMYLTVSCVTSLSLYCRLPEMQASLSSRSINCLFPSRLQNEGRAVTSSNPETWRKLAAKETGTCVSWPLIEFPLNEPMADRLLFTRVRG